MSLTITTKRILCQQWEEGMGKFLILKCLVWKFYFYLTRETVAFGKNLLSQPILNTLESVRLLDEIKLW